MRVRNAEHVRGLLRDLKHCSIQRDLQWGRSCYAKAVDDGNDSNIFVASAAIKMYEKCGSMADARLVFDNIQKPDVVSWTALVLGYANSGEGVVALHLFSRMNDCGLVPDSMTYTAAIMACTSLAMNGGKDNCLKLGRKIHSEIGLHLDHYVQSALIGMYAKCDSMVHAREVFDGIPKPDVVSWNALLMGYVESGEGDVALDLYSMMRISGCVPNCITYVASLKACSSLALNGNDKARKDCLERGRNIHFEIGPHMDHFVQATLIDMYAKCKSMVDAKEVFDSMQKPDAVSCNALLLGYAETGEGRVALNLFCGLKTRGFVPNAVTYVAAFKACSSLTANDCLRMGREIHSQLRCDLDHHAKNTLIDMYAKGGSMEDARCVFDSMQEPDVVSWTVLIMGYAENGEGNIALELLSKMNERRLVPESVTYVAGLKACISLAENGKMAACLSSGREIHSRIRFPPDDYLNNTLIQMYAKCGSMVEALDVFNSMENPGLASWTCLIMGYAESGQGLIALDLFSRMKRSGCIPDSISYLAALKACISLAVTGSSDALKWGREIHSKLGSHLNQYVQGALIDLYAKCGCIADARQVFDSIRKPDVVCWNALLLGYAECGEGLLSLDMISMMNAQGCFPDSGTYVGAFRACTLLAANGDDGRKHYCLERGRELHTEIGCHLNHHAQNALIDMYAKCGAMDDARRVFEGMLKPDVVSWTSLLLGYTDSGDGHIALELFSRMKAAGCVPDSVAYMAALKACVSIGALPLGRKLHGEITKFTPHIVTSLVDFYAKCGSMAEAREVLDRHSRERDATAWSALVAGYASIGDCKSVFSLFEAIKDEGLMPTDTTFVSLLLCCSHAGLVDKARDYLEAMLGIYKVTPSVRHYSCMVDVLGRANLLSEALGVVQKMPYIPDAITWMTLLGACHKWNKLEIARLAFQALASMDKLNPSAYVVMANIFGTKELQLEICSR